MNKEQLKALRKAQRIIFAHEHGKGRIVTKKTLPAKGEYPETELSVEIPVNSIVRSIGESELTETAACYHSEHTDTRSRCFLRTILDFLKVGDEVTLEWLKGYETNGHLKEVGLRGDRLDIRIKRKGRYYTFKVHSVCTPPNSYGMIR